jgi:hypothetical protein
LASAFATTVGGGFQNTASGARSTVSGGQQNTASGDFSTISGGRGLTLDANADRSFGFHGNTAGGDRSMTISAANTAVLGNVDLWLANNDNTPRSLRFYEQYNTAGAYPNGSNYVGFRAPNSIASDVTWTLPNADGTSGQVLTTNGSGTLSWANDGVINFTSNRNTAAPNATVPVHQLIASGTESDIDIALTPKGTGALTAQVADNDITGGNKRGVRAIDWQTLRSNATEVASGGYSVIAGGQDNTASASYSTVSGGYVNTASGYTSTISGGYSNIASGSTSTVNGGIGNTASGFASTVSGGGSNTASGIYTAISGGYFNTASGDFSTISGGRGLTLDANADRSFGFHGNTAGGDRNMTISAANTAVLGNVDL